MKNTFYCLFFFFSLPLFSQTQVSGKVSDKSGQALPGASVMLLGTFDGTSAEAEGLFRFTTSQKDTGTLVVSYLGYKTIQQAIQLGKATGLELRLEEEQATLLKEVVISAGTFEASDEKRLTVLKPIDIVTTAGAGADVFKALQVLPGAAQVGEQEGLFVRGGAASETKAVIDGLIVQNPFFSSVPNVAQRGRFSAFQFKGTAFSTGGYSALYGQALSSVILLETHDLAPKSAWNAGINFASVYGGYAHRWEKASLDYNANYFNVGPVLYHLNSQRIDWQKAPEGNSQTLNFRWKPSPKGIFKAYLLYSGNRLAMAYHDPTQENGRSAFALRNRNFYSNVNFTEKLKKGQVYLGFSQSFNQDKLILDSTRASRADQRTQVRVVLTHDLSEAITLNIGTEWHYLAYENVYATLTNHFDDLYGAVFAEAEVYLSPKLVSRIGLRGEYSRLMEKANLAPRTSLAYKTGEYSQVSAAFGGFYQQPNPSYLYLNPKLDFEKALHLLLNYQLIRNKRTFRAEVYHKSYQQLVQEQTSGPFDANPFRFPGPFTANTGHGYARGVDLFFRDNKSFEDTEYWISYSLLDTRRLYANFPIEAMPTFASTHNLNLLVKRYLPKLSTQVNITYTYASGRPYYNPNAETFMQDRTPAYHNLSLSLNYLTSLWSNLTVVYAEVGNVLGREQVFGYRYSADGQQRMATNPPALRTLFLGMHISIDKLPGKKANKPKQAN
jgi:hypothetical protein